MSYLAVIALLLSAFGAFAMPADSTSEVAKTSNDSFRAQLEQQQLLQKARTANGDLYSALKSFVCREEIERYKGDLSGSKSRSIDHVSAKLSFENGVEHYNDVRQNDRSRGELSALTGAWSEGEFGTLLQQTARLLATQAVTFVSFETVAGVQTAVYRFAVLEKESPWDLEVGSQHYQIPFTTDVWISVGSGDILKIARKSTNIPDETRISEIDWGVSLSAVDLNGKAWLLPSAAAYSVSYGESKRREWNEMSFSNYHRYGAESALSFDVPH
jgi:hypothetical protein